MKIYVVLEQSPRGTRISKVFSKVADAIAWRTELQGSDEYLDFDSAYQYFVEEWEVAIIWVRWRSGLTVNY